MGERGKENKNICSLRENTFPPCVPGSCSLQVPLLPSCLPPLVAVYPFGKALGSPFFLLTFFLCCSIDPPQATGNICSTIEPLLLLLNFLPNLFLLHLLLYPWCSLFFYHSFYFLLHSLAFLALSEMRFSQTHLSPIDKVWPTLFQSGGKMPHPVHSWSCVALSPYQLSGQISSGIRE